MAGVLEKLQLQIEELTTAINKLTDQVKGLEHIGDLNRNPNPLDSKESHCKGPARESGYVNWDESHDSIRNMKWIDVDTLDTYHMVSDIKQLQDRSLSINENTRFPEKKNPELNLYVDMCNPKLICELFNYTRHDMGRLGILVKDYVHTRSSFEEKYKLRWVDPKEQTLLKEAESEVTINEESATEPSINIEIKEVDQKIADNEKDQQIIGKVITNNIDTLVNHEAMPIINTSENCVSDLNTNSKAETPIVFDNTQIILSEENPATVDILSIDPTSSQKLQDIANVLTQNTGNDLIVPLNSTNDSLFIQDSSVSLNAPEDEATGVNEDLSENAITSDFEHQHEEDNKSLELLEILPEMLDVITQSKSNMLVTELSTLDLSHKKPLNIVVELFVDNFSDIMEELTKKKVNMFLQQVKNFKISKKEHFNILIELLCEKIVEEPDLAHHFANMCRELSDDKEFRSLLINKCQNDFESFVLDDNQKIEEDHQMDKRCIGIIRFIGELYNRDMITTKIIDYCLRTLIVKSTEKHLECTCEFLNISGRKLGLEHSTELSNALKQMDELLSSEPNPNNICHRVTQIMQNTLQLSKRKWRTFPLPMTLDHIEKRSGRKRLLMNLLEDSETQDRENTRIGTSAWFYEDRFEPEKIKGKTSHIKYSVETLKLAVKKDIISYIKEPPTYFENIHENNSILEKFQADPTTHNDKIISYQETIHKHVDSKDSTPLTTDLSQYQYEIVRNSIQEFIENSNTEQLMLNIESEIPSGSHRALMDFILDKALTSQHTGILSNAMYLLVETNVVKLDIFKDAINEIFFTVHILFKNIPFPTLYEKLTCILAPHIERHNITLKEIFVISNNIIIVKEGHHFLGTLLRTLKERNGEAFVIALWVDSKLSPVQWMFSEMVLKWVADYKLSFLKPHLFCDRRPNLH